MQLSDLKDVYGLHFLSYVYATPSESGPNEGHLEKHKDVTRILIRACEDIPSSRAGFPVMTFLSGLSNYDARLGTSLANGLRLKCGGKIPEVQESGDQVTDLMAHLMRDVWPLFLLPTPSKEIGFQWPNVPIGIFQHPLLAKFFDTLIKDEDFSSLFPSKPEKESNSEPGKYSEYKGMIDFNTGQGGSFQTYTFIHQTMSFCVRRTLMENGTLAWGKFIEQLSKTIETSRRLAKRRTAKVPVLVGLTGFELPDNGRIQLHSGTLRQPSDFEKSFLMDRGSNFSVVYDTEFTLQILRVEQVSDDGDDWDRQYQSLRPRVEEAQKSFQHSLDLVKLSLLLCSEPGKRHSATEVARHIMNPLAPGDSISYPQSQILPRHSFTIDNPDELRDWDELVNRKHVKSLDIGMKRIISACTSRWDSNDAFVDALICWENAFGTSNETTFRVTRSLAKLIEPADIEKRRILSKELKDLYDKRSRLVHGSSEPPAKEASKYKDRAIEIALECLRNLYRDRPDLLQYPSDQRSEEILLE